MNWNIVIGIVVVVYVGLWVADLWTAPTPEARRRILQDVAETSVLAAIVATLVWCMS